MKKEELIDILRNYKYPEVDWKKAMCMRGIITHHYADFHAGPKSGVSLLISFS